MPTDKIFVLHAPVLLAVTNTASLSHLGIGWEDAESALSHLQYSTDELVTK